MWFVLAAIIALWDCYLLAGVGYASIRFGSILPPTGATDITNLWLGIGVTLFVNLVLALRVVYIENTKKP